MEKYIVTYLANYPCGHRHTLRIAMEAHDAMEAIAKSQAVFTDEQLTSTNHTLFSVMPEGFNKNTISSLDACSKAEVKS
ncbi:hypothetical protein [Xenorhabdus hominickii]|uniref:Uncharacterized protein n=1 Tax=Xenorhabdus hominickii TaxID=351679 RepID=A0A2G0Q183_XENHO|nr:hypothetical protein [Xenorhabdus hominickii]AOM39988.1 hypothetical protein A9255_05010 [Xenorhabdus hominickii]PHM52029.1 hypothetical protein Xhom_04678 [Xenorhabdus hominickii]PHM52989.1 hypothetical protein Xhom_03871 [Xenorhabdus hominickii]PHM53783.1 hypothetical protein Xhom_03784 [Xenorhabdus hominickii]